MITLEQARKLVEQGDDLIAQRLGILERITRFERVESDTVLCIAYPAGPEGLPAYQRPATTTGVEMLPVPKAQAISALARQLAKVNAKLAELGVDASDADYRTALISMEVKR